jgi:hypothetical protein
VASRVSRPKKKFIIRSGTKPDCSVEAILPDNLAVPVQSQAGTDDGKMVRYDDPVTESNPRAGFGNIYQHTFRAPIWRPDKPAWSPGFLAL